MLLVDCTQTVYIVIYIFNKILFLPQIKKEKYINTIIIKRSEMGLNYD